MMRAIDVMSSPVISIKPEATVQEAASVLAVNRISGAPVIEESGVLLGMISEADLLRRVELGTEVRQHRSDESRKNRGAASYVKSYGRFVIDVMTEAVMAVEDTAPLSDVARLLEQHHIRRLPVMRAGRVVGIISRADLAAALAAASHDTNDEAALSDAEIHLRLVEQLNGRDWDIDEHQIDVCSGIVHIWNARSLPHIKVHALIVMAERLVGVKGVEVHDETTPPASSI
jgi:CBS domain-containing protein